MRILRAAGLSLAIALIANLALSQDSNDRCGCDRALTAVALTESVRSNDVSSQQSTLLLNFCESTFEESKDNSQTMSRGNYAVIIFDGDVNYSRDKYDQKKREVCNVERRAIARQQALSQIRTGPSVAALESAYQRWGECKRNCRAWGLSCFSSPAVQRNSQTCVRVNIIWSSPYVTDSARITAMSLSPGLVANRANLIGQRVTGVPFLDVCMSGFQTGGSVSINVMDTLGGSTAGDRCEVGVARPSILDFGAINANQYDRASSVNVQLSDTEARWFVDSVDLDLPARFYVASTAVPGGITRARLMMNFASTVPTRIRVGVVSDDASAAVAPANALREIDISGDSNPANLATSATRRNVSLGMFDVRAGRNYIVIAADRGGDLPRINGFWFEQ